MSKKSFFWGLVAGVFLTFVGIDMNESRKEKETPVDNDPIKYLENPESYENKKKTSFQVVQVLDKAAIAREFSDGVGDRAFYMGTTVLILGENYYTDQVITIKNPQIIGTYNYAMMRKTVPVIVGEIE